MLKRPLIISELSDWIEKLDSRSNFNLDPMEGITLRDLLIQARKHISDLDKELVNLRPEPESPLKKQVQAEIQKQMAKIGIKE